MSTSDIGGQIAIIEGGGAMDIFDIVDIYRFCQNPMSKMSEMSKTLLLTKFTFFLLR